MSVQVERCRFHWRSSMYGYVQCQRPDEGHGPKHVYNEGRGEAYVVEGAEQSAPEGEYR